MSENLEDRILEGLKKEIDALLGLKTREDAIAKGIEDLTNEDKIKILSNLYPFEDEEMALLLHIAREFELDWLKDYVMDGLLLRCSVGGWRARQLENIATAKEKKKSTFGFLGRLFRREKKKDSGEWEF